ncbi:MAG: hypothetical protein AAFQ81_06295 [Pseudomonadota bacterium]
MILRPKPVAHRRSRAFATALVAGGLALGVVPAGASPLTDGLWQGETEGDRAKVKVRASIVSGLGELTLEASGRTFKGTLRCRYLLTLEDDQITETLRRENLSSADCPNDLDPALADAGSGTLALSFAGEDMPALEPAKLFRRIGPVPPLRRAILPEGLDVLGASLGATRAAVEAILIDERGYAPQDDRLRRVEDEGYVAEIVHYGRKPEFEDANVADDLVVIAYEGAADAAGAALPEARAVSIRRRWVTHPEAGITLEALSSAVDAKYGAGEITRFYDRMGEQAGGMVKEGRLLTRPRPYCRTAMEDAGREGGVYEQKVSIPGQQSKFTTGVFALCGSFASAVVSEKLSSKTGLKHPVLDLHIASYDMMNDEIWKRVAARLSADLAAGMARENPGKSAAKPEL